MSSEPPRDGGSATAEAPSLSQPQPSWKEWILCLTLPFLMMFLSISLIQINQHLMKEDHFPYPFALVIAHCVFCSLFALILLRFQPQMFPALTDPDLKVELSAKYMTTAILPIAVCFAVSLVGSNLAYRYCTVAFLQMVKEANIISIYVMALMAGIDTFSWTQASILLVMLTATWSCVEGELNFSLFGFLTQMISSLCECAKTIFQALVLSGKGQKLDPLSSVLVVMPVCGLILFAVLLFNSFVLGSGFAAVPSVEEVYLWHRLLMCSTLNAFALNVTVAMFLKYLGPVIYILFGNIKDVLVVCMATYIIRETVSLWQVIGFTTQVACVFSWTSYKQYGTILPPALRPGFLGKSETTSTTESKKS